MFRRTLCLLLSVFCICIGLVACKEEPGEITGKEISVEMKEYGGGLKNPLKGLRAQNSFGAEYESLAKWYIRWIDIEESADDGLDKLIAYSNNQWGTATFTNTKVIPRVYLKWPDSNDEYGGNYWPSDMTTGDYESPEFRERLVAMIKKMAQAWDNDPRVAYIEMGLIGAWGEQHTPTPSLEMQQLLAETFKTYFKNKLVMVRYPGNSLFMNNDFGLYWDEWGSDMQWAVWDRINLVLQDPYVDRWKTSVFGGENTNNLYGFGDDGGRFLTYGIPYPFTADEAFRSKLQQMIDYARLTHTNHMQTTLASSADAHMNMQTFQNTLGYRFVIQSATYTSSANPGGRFRLSFQVTNMGASPFYYDWPVQVTLLDPETRQPVYKEVMDGVSISDWMPGEGWNTETSAYTTPAPVYDVEATLQIPKTLEKGEYLLALTMLDPAGLQPAAVFANKNYITGGYTVLGTFGVGSEPEPLSDSYKFNKPDEDNGLQYCLNLSNFTTCTAGKEDAAAAVDGSTTTLWTASSNGKQTLTVDLGQIHRLKSLEVLWENPTDYTVEVSEDGKKWGECDSRIISCKNQVTRSYLEKSGIRYVRLQLQKTATGSPASLYAINVYGE